MANDNDHLNIARTLAKAMLITGLTIGAASSQAQEQPAGSGDKKSAQSRDIGVEHFGRGKGASRGVHHERGSGERTANKEKEKRGNTPPGTDRAGDAPASGAIVDPAGVTK